MSDLKFYIGSSQGRHFEASIQNLSIDLANKNVVLIMSCYEITEQGGPEIQTEISTRYGRMLIANNSTLVHPETGQYWDKLSEGGKEGFEPIGEWDFFWTVAQFVDLKVVPFILQTLVKNRERLMPQGFSIEEEPEV